MILRYMQNPDKLRHKAAAPYVPCARRPIGETVGRFLDMHRELVCRVARSRGLDTKGTRVQSPFVPWLWYALGFSFDLALAHERRHLCQAWRVQRQLTEDL